MRIENFPKILFCLFLLSLFSSSVYAADLEITCFEDQKPIIVRNTDPLFQLTNFAPGDIEQRDVYINNTDPNNICKIYIQGKGDVGTLGNMIDVKIKDNIFQDTLSEFVIKERILLAELNSNEQITRNIELTFNTIAGNDYSDKKISFDIIILSEWGTEQDDGDVLGTNTSNPSEGEVLGTSTILPSTGTPTYMSMGAIFFMILGLFLLIKQRYIRRSKKII